MQYIHFDFSMQYRYQPQLIVSQHQGGQTLRLREVQFRRSVNEWKKMEKSYLISADQAITIVICDTTGGS